jgi:DNA-binding LacI/PurR family transcriptional regulator
MGTEPAHQVKLTIAEIAAMAGVSNATVSNTARCPPHARNCV